MRNLTWILLAVIWIPGVSAQTYLGIFESGDPVPFLVVAADAVTGEPTNPINLGYSILKSGSVINTGSMSLVSLGVASATYDTSGNTVGNYQVLIAGQIRGVTVQTYQTFSLVAAGHGPENVGIEVAGLNGVSPLSASVYPTYHNELLSTIRSRIESATEAVGQVQAGLDALSLETKIATRERARSRLWYAQSTIDTATRKVPADFPSHLEVQLAGTDEVSFATPAETLFKIYYYPDALNATKPSQEIRSSTPPLDGTFYLLPNIPW